MYSRKLADDRAIADLDIGHRSVPILQVLRLHADAGIGENLTARSDRRVSVDDRALFDNGPVADDDIFADMGIGADLDVCTEPGAIFHNCSLLNLHFKGVSLQAGPPGQSTSARAAR